MKSLIAMVAIATLTITSTSCKKETGRGAVANRMGIPWSMGYFYTPSTNQYVDGISTVEAEGLLLACKLSGDLKDTFGNTVPHACHWTAAMFHTGRFGYMVYRAGVDSVAVNSIPLGLNNGGIFTHGDSVSTWNEGALNHWYVSRSDTVPGIDVKVAGTMPSFFGTIPDTIYRTGGFSFAFNSTNTANGDSVFIVLSGLGSNGPRFSNVVSARGGTVTFSPSELAVFSN